MPFISSPGSGGGGGGLELIQERDFAAQTSTFTFTSIPLTYHSLLLRGTYRGGLNPGLRINGDSGASSYEWYATNNGASSGHSFDAADNEFQNWSFSVSPQSTDPAGDFGWFEILFWDYTDTSKNRLIIAKAFGWRGTSGRNSTTHGAWKNTSDDILSISVGQFGGSGFVEPGCNWRLYGLTT